MAILIIGESGSGKSTSIRNLDPKETFIIKCLNKRLPFKAKGYSELTKDNADGNVFITTSHLHINKLLKKLNEEQKFKQVIIDDAQNIIIDEFMRRSGETGFVKYSEMAEHTHSIINTGTQLTNITPIYLWHSETDNEVSRCKTVGKLLNEKITIEGYFTVVLQAIVKDDKYVFQTQKTSNSIAKSPMGMFEDMYIDNDLDLVIKAFNEYWREDEDIRM